MSEPGDVLVRPQYGGPRYKKNASVGFKDGAITATDRKGARRSFPLAEGESPPARFTYGIFSLATDCVLVDAAGAALLVVDGLGWDLSGVREASGLRRTNQDNAPPLRPDTFVIADFNYMKVFKIASPIGAVAWGLSGFFGDILIYAVTLPALAVMFWSLVMAKMTIPNKKTRAKNYADLQASLKELDELNKELASEAATPPADTPTPHADTPTEPA